MKKEATLVVAVYNAVRYLEFILIALRRQSLVNFELIIADDGSQADIKALVDRARGDAPFPITHLWQPDEGFRKNAILNKAIEASHTGYLIFIDGDCLPHHHFVKDHWIHRKANSVLCGRRVNFSRQITDRLRVEDIRSGRFERMSVNILLDGLMARSSNLEDALRIESPLLRTMLHRNKARILGCNFSVDKKLLERINGFNEEYEAPGIGEDSDIAFRLELVGARMVTLRYLAILYHLYHPATVADDVNKKIYERVVATREVMCRKGLRNLDLKLQKT